MNRLGHVVIALAFVAAGGCDRKKTSGLPPADQWSGGQAPIAPNGNGTGGPLSPHGGLAAAGDDTGNGNDPHAGMNLNGMGGAGGSAGADPHAGLDMNGMGGATGANPHGGGGAGPGGDGVDVTQLGLSAPDPNRPIDPNHVVRGVIKLGGAAVGKAKQGGIVFIVAKRADASGHGSGPPLAVDRLIWPASGDLAFELTDAQQMVAGTTLDGDIVVSAHYDQDGEARSKQPGDLLGEVRVKVPSDKIVLPLDNVIPDGGGN